MQAKSESKSAFKNGGQKQHGMDLRFQLRVAILKSGRNNCSVSISFTAHINQFPCALGIRSGEGEFISAKWSEAITHLH